MWIVRSAARIRAIAEDAESDAVEADIVISQLIDEPLISDMLAGKLSIAVEDFLEVQMRGPRRGQGKARYQGNFRPFRTDKFALSSGISSSGIQEMMF